MNAMHPANKIENLRRRVRRARRFPDNTCPASRHLQIMAECLLTRRSYPMLQDDPEHCAGSMLSVLESLYKARNELARSRKTAPGGPAEAIGPDEQNQGGAQGKGET